MDNLRFSRIAGVWQIIGALVGVGVGVKEALAPTPFGTTENLVMQSIVLVANTLALVGVLGLARSGAAGDSRMARAGLAVALLGSALFLPFEVIVTLNEDLGGMLLGIAALLQALGLLLAGIAVLRAGHWQGWLRFAPLLCALYTLVVLMPVLAMSDGYNAWALAGWQLPFLLLGLALYQQSPAPATGIAAADA